MVTQKYTVAIPSTVLNVVFIINRLHVQIYAQLLQNAHFALGSTLQATKDV